MSYGGYGGGGGGGRGGGGGYSNGYDDFFAFTSDRYSRHQN